MAIKKSFTIEELKKALLAVSDLERTQRNLVYLRKEESEAQKALERIKAKILQKEKEQSQLENVAAKAKAMGFEELISLHSKIAAKGSIKKRLATSTKRAELNRYLKTLKENGRETVRLSEVKNYFERNVIGAKMGNVTQFFREVIPEQMFVASTSTRNRSIFIREIISDNEKAKG